jgi:hypothetical protein
MRKIFFTLLLPSVLLISDYALGSMPIGYCIGSANNTYGCNISNVTMGSLNNSSSSPGNIPPAGYTDFTGICGTSSCTTLNAGAKVSFSLSFSKMNPVYAAIYIDFNRNAVFESNERVYSPGAISANIVYSSFTVPSTITGGDTRMRVMVSFSPISGPCDLSSATHILGNNGEAEDYEVRLKPSYCPAYNEGGGLNATLSSVSFGSYTNNSGYTPGGYTDYSNLPINLQSGSTNTLLLNGGSWYPTNPVILRTANVPPHVYNVYIDYNNNGSYDDPGELVYTSPFVFGGTQTDISIPSTLNGTYQMRITLVAVETGYNTGSCGDFGLYGEVEDYTINICSGINLTSGLLAYYPFNGDANDATGLGHNGTVYNGVLPTTDRTGAANKAYFFDGIDDYIDLGNAADLKRSNTDYSIAVWVNPASFSSSYQSMILSNRGNSGQGSALALLGDLNGAVNKGKVSNIVNNAGGASLIMGTTVLIPGTWYQIVVTYKYSGGDNNSVQIFVNCNREAASVQKNITDPGTLSTYIGFEPSPACPPEYHYNGKIDDLRIYNRVLSDCEIQALCQLPADRMAAQTANSSAPLSGSSFSFFPNPSSGSIEIVGNVSEGDRYDIFDMTGKKLLSGNLNEKIDISSVPEGIYIINIIDKNGNIVKIDKIIKQ